MTASTPEQNAAYRAGLCVGLCGTPPMAGHTRCEACHVEHRQPGVVEPGLTRKGEK